MLLCGKCIPTLTMLLCSVPQKTVRMYPFQIHSIALSTFASLIGPFGGFFASGFKRAFKIKVRRGFWGGAEVLRVSQRFWGGHRGFGEVLEVLWGVGDGGSGEETQSGCCPSRQSQSSRGREVCYAGAGGAGFFDQKGRDLKSLSVTFSTLLWCRQGKEAPGRKLCNLECPLMSWRLVSHTNSLCSVKMP